MNSRLRIAQRCLVLGMALTLAAIILPLNAQDDEAQARRFYAAGNAALQDNDFDIAARNFERAAALAPKNALIRLKLAAVQSQLGNVGDATTNLKIAIDLGLEGDYLAQARNLQGELDYKAEKFQKTLSPFVGTWRAAGGGPGRDVGWCWVVEGWTEEVSLSVKDASGSLLRGKDIDKHSHIARLNLAGADAQVQTGLHPDCGENYTWTVESDWTVTAGSGGLAHVVSENGVCRTDRVTTNECASHKKLLTDYSHTLKLQDGKMIETDEDGRTNIFHK